MKGNRKLISKGIVGIIGGFFSGLGGLGTFIFLRDRKKQWLEESVDFEKRRQSVNDDEVKQIRAINKKDYENLSDEEIKDVVGNLKIENKKREDFIKELEEIRKKNRID